MEFEHTFFECKGVNNDEALVEQFEFVLLNAESLGRRIKECGVDSNAFAQQFAKGSSKYWASFPNMNSTACLVCPKAADGQDENNYVDLKTFMMNVSAEQIDSVLQQLGVEFLQQLDAGSKVYLSTCGTSVLWLHFRLEPEPKYYNHRDYQRIIAKMANQDLVEVEENQVKLGTKACMGKERPVSSSETPVPETPVPIYYPKERPLSPDYPTQETLLHTGKTFGVFVGLDDRKQVEQTQKKGTCCRRVLTRCPSHAFAETYACKLCKWHFHGECCYSLVNEKGDDLGVVCREGECARVCRIQKNHDDEATIVLEKQRRDIQKILMQDDDNEFAVYTQILDPPAFENALDSSYKLRELYPLNELSHRVLDHDVDDDDDDDDGR